ncbi:putative glycerol kinase 5 isoform X2 [Anabrus simplex]|uniref:putative glycerol kinase 5 isoform X2 n=1 Tax=Anabrus simplex TaxID=316456 RepID=UPI0034DDA82C
MAGKFVAALDVGTTTVRCHILDQSTATIGTACDKVELLYPKDGYEEIEPEQLWRAIVNVITEAIKAAGVGVQQVACLGISTQRSTFITWHRETGKPFHNFITWKDIRADKLVQEWNNSFTMKTLRGTARCLYTATRSKRFLAASVLKLMNSQVTVRLMWALQNIADLKEAASKDLAMFGTVDTWLLYRLSGGKLHVTDVSNASATGFYDPFIMQWSGLSYSLFRFPASLLPEVWDTAGDFGCTSSDLFGAEIPICCVMADQAASTFGSCCFDEGDIKVTMGTGTFLNLNTGRHPHASVAGLLSEPAESNHLSSSVKDSGGVFFVPAFSGLQAPVNDAQAAAGFLGIKPTTTKNHMVRAMLESIVFRVLQLYETLQKEANYCYSWIRVDGGVSKNDFVMQLLADITGLKVERPSSSEMTVLGVGFLAGLSAGMWKSKDELRMLRKVERVFQADKERSQTYLHTFQLWNEALKRFLRWNHSGSS